MPAIYEEVGGLAGAGQHMLHGDANNLDGAPRYEASAFL